MLLLFRSNNSHDKLRECKYSVIVHLTQRREKEDIFGIMLYGLRQRLQFFKDAFARPMVTIVGGVIFLLTLAVTIRDGILPPEYQQWRVLEILPHWPWYTWTIVVLTFLLIVVW